MCFTLKTELYLIKLLIINNITMLLAGFEFSLIELIILAVFFIAFIYQLFYYHHYINGPLSYHKKLLKSNTNLQSSNPGVSVIICARDEADNLRKNLVHFLEQDYPEFEVIVVNDGSTDESEILLNNLKDQYPHLRSTFVPYGAKNLSTKKLALTLGIKAAKYDWVLLSDADCIPNSKEWIAKMARNFNQGVEFVLGYSPYLVEKTAINKLITFDTLFNALQYLGFAYRHKPYMGVGRNMAYRKEVFFRMKGFASNLHLRSGDDDLMVNSAANAFNTKIEVSPESIVWSEPKKTAHDWLYQKERHLSVSTHYNSISKFNLTIEPISRGLFYASLILLFIFGNIPTMIAALVVYVWRLTTQLIILNKSSKHFGGRNYFTSVIVLDIYLPLVNLFILTFGRMGSKSKRIVWK